MMHLFRNRVRTKLVIFTDIREETACFHQIKTRRIRMDEICETVFSSEGNVVSSGKNVVSSWEIVVSSREIVVDKRF